MIRILELFQRPWALQANYLEKAYQVIARHEAGIKLNAEDIEAATGGRPAANRFGYALQVVDGQGIIPIQGVISRHAALVNDISGPRGTSVERIRNDLNAAVADPNVEEIVLDIDSPGGSVSGVDELADEIRAAAAIKPVYAYTDSLMASAAYWLGCAATAVYAQRTAEVGSIGVYCVVDDLSVRAHNLGIKVHLVKAGANKGEFVDGLPVSAESLSTLQEDVDQYYAFFTGAVSQNRRLSMAETLAAANGRSFLASAALSKGLIDGIRTRAEMFAPKSAGRPNTGARTMDPKDPKATTDPQPPANPPAPPAVVTDPAPPATASAASIAAAAVAEERTRLNALDGLKETWAEHSALIDRCKADGTSFQGTTDLVLAAEGKLKQARLAEIRGGGKTTDPLAGGNADKEAPETFSADAVKERFASDSAYAAKYRTVDVAIEWERARHEAAKQPARR